MAKKFDCWNYDSSISIEDFIETFLHNIKTKTPGTTYTIGIFKLEYANDRSWWINDQHINAFLKTDQTYNFVKAIIKRLEGE